MSTNFMNDFLSDLGFDPRSAAVEDAREDASEHQKLIDTLIRHRKQLNLVQKDVADRMGTTQSRVSTLERLGSDPHLSTLFRYARAVDLRLRVVATVSDRGWTPFVATSAVADDGCAGDARQEKVLVA